jgi:divalent metal cation (Fe/Co/Zn/Cd) transporter
LTWCSVQRDTSRQSRGTEDDLPAHGEAHPHAGPHRHLRHPRRSRQLDLSHRHHHDHGHSHGLVDASIKRSRAGLRAVSASLAILAGTAAVQAAIYVATGSVALLADLIHNLGDALTAVPLGTAFLLRSARVERYAGLAVVFAIFVSACVAGVVAVEKIIDPHAPEHLLALGIAGAVGFVGNELAARVRLGAGRRLDSPALVADGYHARTDGFVSLGVMASAALVAVGLPLADPVIAIVITAIILRITWQSWLTVRGRAHAP